MLKQVLFVNLFESLADNELLSLGLGHGVDVLNLDKGLEIGLEHSLEEILQLISSEEFEDFFPFRRVFEFAEIRFHVSGKHSQSRRLSNSVCSNESENLS